MRTVFDDSQVPDAGNSQDLVEVRKVHAQVHGKNSPRFGSDFVFDEPYVQAIRVRVHVNENRNSIQQQNRTYRALPRVGGDDDFIAWFDTNRSQADFYCYRAVSQSNAVFCAVSFGEFRGERTGMSVGKGIATPIARAQYPHECSSFFI